MIDDQKKFRSLKSILTTALAAMIVTLVVFVSVIAATTSYSTVKNIYFDQLVNSSKDIARQMEHFYNQQEKNARFLAKDATIINALKTGKYKAATKILKSFFDEEGIYENVFISSPKSDTSILADGMGGKSVGQHWREGFEENIDNALNEKLFISSPKMSPTTGRPVVLVTAPIMDGKTLIGILGLPFDIGSFSSALVQDAKMGKTGHSYITSSEGVCLAHPRQDLIMVNIADYDWGKEILSKPSGSISKYTYDGLDKFVCMVKSDKFGIIAATTIGLSDINGYAFVMARNIILVGILCTVLTVLAVMLFMHKRLNPLKKAVAMLSDIAHGEGDLTKRLDVVNRDEIGELALYFNQFVDKLHVIIKEIKGNANVVASSAEELSATSAQTSQSVQTLSSKTSTVASSAEEFSANSTHIASRMDQVSQTLSVVANSIEEMTSTIGEIAVTSEKARGISSNAGSQAASISALMNDLAPAVKDINRVTEIITGISAQTNLLALNATIEAARAGSAGKGFAVVAGEIKDLAQQTVDATEDIKSKIDSVQGISGSVIECVEEIARVISEVDQNVAGIAAAIEEQSVVAKDVAANTVEVSNGVIESNDRVSQTASVSQNMAQELAGVDVAASEIRISGEHVHTSASELAKLAEQLQMLVGQFKVV